MRRVFVILLLAAVLVLVLSTAATAKKPEPPHFVTRAMGTLDSWGDPYDPYDGIPYPTDSGEVNVPGYIDLKIDIESVCDASGPYNDGTDFAPKWDYETQGWVKATIHLIDPDGNRVNRHVKLEVDEVTISQGYLGTWYAFDVTYEGDIYGCYVGQGNSIYHAYLPVLGAVLGDFDNYSIVRASGGEDFSYDLSDSAVTGP